MPSSTTSAVSGTCGRARYFPTPSSTSWPDSTPSCSARSGTPDVPPGVLERGLLLRLRFEFDLYVNLRPVRLLPGAPTPLAGKGPDDIDMVVIRENTEGAYAGEGGFLRKGTPNEIATQGSVNTRLGAERCVRYAFELARNRPRKHLTLCHKTNVLTFSGDLWQRAFNDVASEYPDVETGYVHVDAACLYMVESPERFDVVVTDNLFGDILTDLGAAIAGGMGLAASGNLNPPRERPSLFEPVHGSAPDIAGTGKANPLAAVLSAAMLARFLGEEAAADRTRTCRRGRTLEARRHDRRHDGTLDSRSRRPRR